ncbi:MAG TPA: hypothetical protein VFB83_01425 [Propionibacteriaceae bacterium]|nr:hypothetical protein [Propionibacteriaceae bacterium]
MVAPEGFAQSSGTFKVPHWVCGDFSHADQAILKGVWLGFADAWAPPMTRRTTASVTTLALRKRPPYVTRLVMMRPFDAINSTPTVTAVQVFGTDGGLAA